MSEEEQELAEKQNWTFPIKWHIPDAIQSRYATNVVVQTGQHEFIISFFEVIPPIILGESEEGREEIGQLKVVQGECIGRFIVPPEQIPSIIAALQTTWDAYQEYKHKE